MSKKLTPVAQNELSKKEKNVVNVYHTSCLCYFRPETGDVIFLSESDAGEFDTLTNKLSQLMDQLEKSRDEHSEAIEEYYKKRNDISSQDQLSAYFDVVVSSELAVEKATQAIQQEVGEFNEQVGYLNIIELIPLEPLKKGVYGRFYCYLKQSDYEAMQSKLTIINLNDFGTDDFYQRDQDGNIVSINIAVILDKFKKVKEALKQMASSKRAVGVENIYEAHLTDWAHAWNQQGEYVKEGKRIDVSAGAQFLRFSSNAGAMVEWDEQNKTGRISGEAHATLTLASAYAKTTFYRPDRGGWPLKFIINDQNKEANLGVLRARIETTMTGFAGASAKIEGSLQFVVSDDQQKLMGTRAPVTHFAQRQKGVRVDEEKVALAPASVSVELFAGVSSGGSFGGGLQWLKPFDSLVDHLPGMLKTFGLDNLVSDNRLLDKTLEMFPRQESEIGKFTDFASFVMGDEYQAGIGFSGGFLFGFENGKFIYHISAGLCLGIGAKGFARGEIAPKQFLEFAVWAVYQLYGMDYRRFSLFDSDAFKALTYILVMGGEDVYKRYFEEMKDGFNTVLRDFSSFAYDIKSNVNSAFDASNSRNYFADLINESQKKIYHFTPEAKGISLYLLVQDGIYDRIDLNNHRLASIIDNTENGLFPWPDTGHERKKAVLHILSSIQTKREWVEVLVRMTADGEKITGTTLAESELVKQQEQTIRTFLQIGLNQDQKLEALINQLELRDFRELYQRLKDKPAFGYPFAPNCTKQYALYCDDNPWYTSLCRVTPQNQDIKHNLEPINK